MDPWMAVLSRGRIVAYATEPWGVEAVPLPVDIPCDDLLVVACRQVGVPVYPVFVSDVAGAA
jgi:hypothetical protein